MTKQKRKASKPGRVSIMFQSRKARLIAFGLISLIGLSFLFGYTSAKWLATPVAPPVRSVKSANKEILKDFGITPKKLDVDKITGESEPNEVVKEQSTFTFTKTLEKETAPAVNPFIGKEAPVKKEAKPEEKTKPVVVKPVVVKPVVVKPATPTPVKKSASPAQKQKELTVAKTIWPKKDKLSVKPSKPKPRNKKIEAVNRKIYTLQVGSFTTLDNAAKLKRRLEKRGYHVYIQSFITKGKRWNSVRVGIYKTKVSAKRVAAKLRREMNVRAEVRNYRRGS